MENYSYFLFSKAYKPLVLIAFLASLQSCLRMNSKANSSSPLKWTEILISLLK